MRRRARLAGPQQRASALPVRFVDADHPFAFDETSVSLQPAVEAAVVSTEIRTPSEARLAARRLWASLTSSSDGLVDRWFNRPCGRPLSRLLVKTSVTPNQVSVASIVLGLVSAWLLAQGRWRDAVLGSILFQISAVVDCVDGDLARMVFKESPLGKWLDLVGDQLVHSGVFIGIAVGLLRAGTSAPAGWLGMSAVLGALFSFGVVLRGMMGDARPSGRLQGLLDRATNRDFSVLVLALALGGMLEWFLWMAAIGSHLFWMTALFLQARAPEPGKAQTELR
jgi:phosphatidylglycerophosphate synthase